MIEDSSGNEDMEEAALKAIKGWKYTPAMENGVPVEQSMTRTMMRFQLEHSAKGARPGFAAKYRKILTFVRERKLEEAEPLLTDLQYREKQNLYEDAFFWWLRYLYLNARGGAEKDELKNSLSRAIGYEEEYLPADILIAASQLLYQLYAEDMEIGYAIDAYERLLNSKGAKRSKNFNEATSALETHVQKLREIIDGNNILMIDARVSEHDYWVYPLVRRSFSIRNPGGNLKLVDIRCSNRTQRYKLHEAEVWNIPEDWGKCCLYIKGEPGTTFTFYEYPKTAAINR
jgi:hypothetical protein